MLRPPGPSTGTGTTSHAILWPASVWDTARPPLWARRDAHGKALEHKHFDHRDVGQLTLTMQTFDVLTAPGQELVVYHAAPSSPSSEALALLGSLAATVRQGP